MSEHCFETGGRCVLNHAAECSGLYDTCRRHNAQFSPSDQYARGVADERARVVTWLKAKRKVSDDAERFAEEISEGYHEEAT